MKRRTKKEIREISESVELGYMIQMPNSERIIYKTANDIELNDAEKARFKAYATINNWRLEQMPKSLIVKLLMKQKLEGFEKWNSNIVHSLINESEYFFGQSYHIDEEAQRAYMNESLQTLSKKLIDDIAGQDSIDVDKANLLLKIQQTQIELLNLKREKDTKTIPPPPQITLSSTIDIKHEEQ